MSELIKTTSEVCQKCKYWHISADCCGYSIETGHCRTVSMGKKTIPKGMCDKFEPVPEKKGIRKGKQSFGNETVSWKRDYSDYIGR